MRILFAAIVFFVALLNGGGAARAAAWDSIELRDRLCHATALDEPAAAIVLSLPRTCRDEPEGYRDQWLWLFASERLAFAPGEAPAHLLVDQTRFGRVRVLIRYADGQVVEHSARSGRLEEHWALGGHLDFSIPSRDVAVTGVAIGFEKLVHYPLMRKVRIMRGEDFNRLQGAWIMTLGLVLGAMGATLLYNLLLYARVADAFQRVYVLWAISAVAYAVCWSNIIFYVFPGLAGSTGVRLNMVFAAGTLGFGSLFFTLFIEPGSLPRRYRQLLDGVAISLLVVGVAAAIEQHGFAPEADRLFNYVALINLFVLLGGVGLAFRLHSRAVRFYAVAWAAPLLVVALRLARNFGWIGQSDAVDMATFLSITVQTVLLSIGIADRLGRLQGERDRANAEREEMRHLAETDPLTGLLNRRGFIARVQSMLTQRGPVGLLIADLDYFKSINDRLGHDIGDHVLERVGRVLNDAVGAGATGRLGGEEFGIAVPGRGAALHAFAERLRREVEAADMSDLLGPAQRVTLSIGVAERGNLAEATFERLYHLADKALYQAKGAGRNRIAAADAELCETELTRPVPAVQPRVVAARRAS